MTRQSISIPLVLAITAGWIAITLLVMLRHEIWLDEAQHWLLAKDSDSLGDLIYNMRYEGHPPLWNLLLFGVSRISGSVLAMQILHLCFAAGTVFLILRYSPFPVWVKIILPFTYFLGYEYAVIARNYAPAVFFVVLACVLSVKARKNILLIATFFSIATMFHIYAGLVALPVLAYLIIGLRKENVTARAIYIPASIFFISLSCAAWLVKVPSDHFVFQLHDIFIPRRVGTMLRLPFTSLMHFPEVSSNYWWNTNIFLTEAYWIKGIIALLFWLVPVFILRADKKIMILYILGAIILSSAMFLTPMPIAVRHAGMIALLYFVCLWLMKDKKVSRTKFFSAGVGVILIVQAGSYFVTVYKDWTQPFSHAKNMAEFIQANYSDGEVAVYPHYLGPSVSAYLDRKVFYAEREQPGTFTDWRAHDFDIDKDEFVRRCRTYMASEKIDSMVLVVYNGPEYNTEIRQAMRVAYFEGAAVRAENYDINILKRE